MGLRQVILDTETTGLRVEEGHRVIEIGCLEMVDRKITGNTFHTYLNPGREIEAAASAVHGITNEQLQDKPVFTAIADDFMNFVNGAEVIIHNAPFDLSFINNELLLSKLHWQALTEYCQIIDTLLLARQRHVGQRNSLDALCKRYGVDNSKRDYHGALLDAQLLAHVYLAMTGGQGSMFDNYNTSQQATNRKDKAGKAVLLEAHDLPVIHATPEEQEAHRDYLNFLKKKGHCLWEGA